jgi:hypothetical protein
MPRSLLLYLGRSLKTSPDLFVQGVAIGGLPGKPTTVRRKRASGLTRLSWVLALLFGAAVRAHAVPIELANISALTNPWLLIGTGAVNNSTTPEGKSNAGVGHAVDVSNFELGANKAPVPANREFGGENTTSYGPGLQWLGNIPSVPGVADLSSDPGPMGITGKLPTPQVITYDGNVAVTAIDGTMNMGPPPAGGFGVSNIGLFAKHESAGGAIPNSLPPGIVCAGLPSADTSQGGCIQNNSNSMFNDPAFPNPIGSPVTTPFDPSDPDVLKPGNGITGDFNFAPLRTALDDALPLIAGLSPLTDPSLVAPAFCKLEINNGGAFIDVCSGNTLNLTSQAGQIKGGTVSAPTNLYVKLNDGLNLVDITTGGNDLLLNNANIIIDGSADARAIFRVPTGKNFNINQGNILIGNMGIGLSNVMFFSATTMQQATFTFNDTLLNGIAFWTLGDGSGIHVNNSQGCVQMVGDKVNLQDVRYMRCGFMEVAAPPPAVPEPPTLLLVAAALGILAAGSLLRSRTGRIH